MCARRLAWIAWALLLPLRLLAAEDLEIDGVDVYGTTRLDGDTVWKTMRAEFDELARTIGARDFTRVQEQKAKIADKLKAQGPFAYVALSPILYFPPTPGLFVTIDVVETQDVARRMPFRPAPTGTYADPDGLLAAWYELESNVGSLASKRELPPWKECPVLHCLSSFDHPLLRPYLERFNTGARANKALLKEIATQDADAKHRAAALYLLAHADDVSLLLPLLGNAMFDSDATVRNAAMRVLSGMSRAGRDLDYPIRDIIAALDLRRRRTGTRRASWSTTWCNSRDTGRPSWRRPFPPSCGCSPSNSRTITASRSRS